MGSFRVALRKESVDRNDVIRPAIDVFLVALRKESVDRNKQIIDLKAIDKRSLSARRAWIEMPRDHRVRCRPVVALRKESVDRNFDIDYYKTRK